MSDKSTETIPHVIKYFCDLHRVLKEEAKLAGLMKHNASVGAAREFFVKRVLRSFLPTYVHIGSGQIMNHLGVRSRQMDVIIYDPKFPFFDIAPGAGVYLHEGVIATVEIKTKLGKRELRSSLRNCQTACSMDFRCHAADYPARISETAREKGIDEEQAEWMLDRRLAAKSYIFAYRTTLSVASMAEGLLEHLASLGGADDWDPRMPRIVVGDGLLAASADADNVKLSLSEEEIQLIPASKRSSAVPVARVYETDLAFPLFAWNLLSKISARIRPSHEGENVKLGPEQYLPIEDLNRAIVSQGRATIVFFGNGDPNHAQVLNTVRSES